MRHTELHRSCRTGGAGQSATPRSSRDRAGVFGAACGAPALDHGENRTRRAPGARHGQRETRNRAAHALQKRPRTVAQTELSVSAGATSASNRKRWPVPGRRLKRGSVGGSRNSTSTKSHLRNLNRCSKLRPPGVLIASAPVLPNPSFNQTATGTHRRTAGVLRGARRRRIRPQFPLSLIDLPHQALLKKTENLT